MESTGNELTIQGALDPDLGHQWVQASRGLSQLQGYLEASALTEVWIRLLVFAEALDWSRAQGSGLDAVTLARESVMRESARSAETRDALQGMTAVLTMLSWPTQRPLTVSDVLQVQSMLCLENVGLRTTQATAAMAHWLHDWEDAAQLSARPDCLLQLPLLSARWLQLQPMTSDHQRMGRLMDMLLLNRAGLVPSMTLLWSRAWMVSAQKLDWRSKSSSRSSDSSLAQQSHMLSVVTLAATMTLGMLRDLSALWAEVSHAVQAQHKFFSPELMLHLFRHPAVRVESLAHDLAVTRLTASRYLDALVDTGILQLERSGRDNIYAHAALQALLQTPDKSPR